ncbi:hypothetical protein [Cupriavidus plantarum]|uniref:hypothetical protein n=2 Tax=Cupriavidus plantarum TaxID=942865 RepID=UPI000E22B241|nr:hypothetical protein [Cupriavidus plantarum]
MKALPLTKANEILAATNKLSQAGAAFVGTDTLQGQTPAGDVARGLDIGHVPIAARLMAEAGLDDEDVAKHLDLAGEVLRNRRLKWSGHPCLCVHGVDGLFKAVTYVLSVRQSRDEVFEMNCELADAEVRANIKRHPYFDITFIAA